MKREQNVRGRDAAKKLGLYTKDARKLLNEYEDPDIMPDGTDLYSQEAINQVAYDFGMLDKFDWHCDNCGSFLNWQFDEKLGLPFAKRVGEHELVKDISPKTWKCTECGYVNMICKDNIIMEHIQEKDK